ncbi:UNVERIFIED_CONTAM: hypothetical protein FKN15_046358 [Acipenser sinensis]
MTCIHPQQQQQQKATAVTASEEPQSAVHHGDVILNCKHLRLQWVKERDGQTETVLAYCGGGVQKSEASASYRDRVYFYPEELTWGSAPLWLHDVELSDQGKYTCYVEDRRVGDSEQMTVHVEVKGADQSESQSILPYAIGVAVCLATVAIIVKILVKLQNEPSAPGEIKIDSVEIDSVSLSWGSPDNMDGIPHSFYITYYSSDKCHQDSITAPSNSTIISKLRPGREYSFTVTTVLKNGTQSTSVSTSVCTKPYRPGEIKIDSVESDSVSLSWGRPDNMDGMPHSFYITFSSSVRSHQDSNSTVISKLRPGREYSFTVTTELENGIQSTPVSEAVCTKPSPPGEIKIDSVESDSVSLSWDSPVGIDGIPHSFKITSCSSDESDQDTTTAVSNSTVISELRPGREYSFTVTTVLENGTQSTPVSTSVCTKPSPPGEIKIDSVEIDSVSLSLVSPDNINGIPHSFYITYFSSDKSHQDSITAPSNSTVISKLRPGREYSFTVTTVLENGSQSTPVSTSVCTKPSPPGEIKIDSMEIDSVSLSWSSPDNMDGIPHSFHITYSSYDNSHQDSITARSNSTVISKLRPGREYSFTVTIELENGTQSTPVSTAVCTKPSPPGQIKIDSVQINSVSLSWGSPDNMDGIPHSFYITYSSSDRSHQDSITAPSNSTVISKLRPGREYSFTVTTVLKNGTQSTPVSTSVCTKLSPLGEIKIDSVEMDSVSLSWGSPVGIDGIPHSFYITYSCSDRSHQDSITAPSNSTVISKLRPGREYSFTVTTVLKDVTQSTPVSTSVCTKLSPAGAIKIDSVEMDSVSLCWGNPIGIDGIRHSFKITFCSSDRSHQDSITAVSNSTVLSKLRPGREYSFTVTTELENGIQSTPVSTSVCTKLSPPGEIKIDSVESDSVSLSWVSPVGIDGIPHSFKITFCSSDESDQDTTTAVSNSTVISKLRPGRDYSFTVTTVLENGTQSTPVSTSVCTKPSPPGEIKIDSVEIDSVSLSWSSPDNMDGIPHSFYITNSSYDRSHQDSITAPSNSTVISKLRPGKGYTFTVTTVLENGIQSMPVSAAVCTKLSPPGKIKINLVESDSVSLSWGSPVGIDEIPHSFKITFCSSDRSHQDSITAVSNSTVISKLRPGREYSFTVTTVLKNGIQSTPVSAAVCTKPSPPGEIMIDSVEIGSVSLSWGRPDNMDGIPHSFYITYASSDRSHQDSITAPSNSTIISKLRPGREYSFTVTTVLENGTQSTPVSAAVCTKLSPPREIKIDSVEIDSVSLSWGSPVGIDEIPHSFKIHFCSSDRSHQDSITAVSNSTVISKLSPGREYSFTVNTVLKNGTQSTPVSAAVYTKPSPPREVKIDSVGSNSVSLCWNSPIGIDEIPHSFKITFCNSDKSHKDSITAVSNSTVISKLRPGREYSFTVTTVLKNGIHSKPVSTTVYTKPSPPGAIMIDSVEIDSVSLSWGNPDNMDGIPHSFYITYSSCDRSYQDSITAPSNSTVISKLRPGREYSFTVTTVLENGTQSTPVSTSVSTKLSPPGKINIDLVESDSVSLSWGRPDNLGGIPHRFYITYSSSDKSHQDTATAPSNSTVISKLRPGNEYSFTVTTVLKNGIQSMPVSRSVCTSQGIPEFDEDEPPDSTVPKDPANSPSTTPASVSLPGEIKIDSVEIDSVSLSWDSPTGMKEIPHSFKITYSSSVKDNPLSITAPSNSTVISELRPGREYSFTINTVLENGTQSMPVSAAVYTKLSPPGEIKIDSVEIDSVSLSWDSPVGIDGIPHSFKITISSSDKSHQDSITAPSNSTVISELRPGREYSFTINTVLENGTQSMPVSAAVYTKLSPPGEIKIDSVEIDSVSLSWDSPVGIDGIPHSFKITISSSDKSHQDSITAPSNSTVISELRPGREYSFTVTTVLENRTQSTPVSATVYTKLSPPGEVKIDSVEIDSVSLSWDSPVGIDGIPHSFKIHFCSSDRSHQKTTTAVSNSIVISKLRPATQYTFRVTTELENGTQSTPVSAAVYTKPSPPGEIQIDSVGSDSVSLSWGSPDNMDGIPHSFYITYASSDRSHQDSITAVSNSTVISKLRPGREYSFTVTTELENGTQSMPVSAAVCTKLSPPGEIKIDSVEIDSVSLCWGSPVDIDGIPHSFKITFCSSDESHQDSITAPSNSTIISKLRPGREYSFTVTTVLENGIQSTPVSAAVCTKPSAPGEIKIDSVETDYVSLSWASPDNMDGIPHSFYITYSSSDKSHQDSITAPSNSTVISKLRPGREYSFTVNTVLENGTQSTPVSTSVCTKLSPPGEVKIDSVEIDSVSLSWANPVGIDGIPHSFKITFCSSDESHQDSITAVSNSTVFSKLRPGREYSFMVTTELENGTQSTPVSAAVCTKPSPPEQIKIDSVEINSVSLSWGSPDNMDEIPHSFYITYSSYDNSHQDSITAPSNSTVISKLRPGREYSFTVTTELENGTQSTPVSTSVCTKLSPLGEIKIDSVEIDSISLSWDNPDNMDGIPHSFYITYSSSDRRHQDSITAPSNSTVISKLRPGREYSFTVTTELKNGTQSTPVSTFVYTKSARAEAEDDSTLDNTVNDLGTEMDVSMESTSQKTSSKSAVSKDMELQVCVCGWSKATTVRGLKIHQGRMKCLREKGQGPRIDQYFLRSQSSQSNEIQRQEANQFAEYQHPCHRREEDLHGYSLCEPGQTNQHKTEKNLNGHKPGVKWPRACEKTAWDTVNTDLCFVLERLRGTVEKKLDKFGDIIYAYGSERFGVEKRKEKVQTIPGKSRQQQEIERLEKGDS